MIWNFSDNALRNNCREEFTEKRLCQRNPAGKKNQPQAGRTSDVQGASRSQRGRGREESIRPGAGDAAGGAVLLNNPFGKTSTQKTQREGPVIYLALPRKVLATSRSYSEEFRRNPAAKGGCQVGCDKGSDHGQVSHDAAGVSGWFCFPLRIIES